tara:strand:+ start:42 stop:224 length:183 start_codon:yes stop_codon:yes gene_type:complete
MTSGENLRIFPPFFFNSAAEEEKMPRKVEGKKEKTPKNMELYCKKRQKLEKSFKIQPIFT